MLQVLRTTYIVISRQLTFILILNGWPEHQRSHCFMTRRGLASSAIFISTIGMSFVLAKDVRRLG